MSGWRKTAVIGLAFLGFAAAFWWIWRSDARRANSDFRWFETLGFPGTKSLPYVRVATGGWSQADDEPPQNTYLHGFLLPTNNDSFTVLLLDLSVRSFTNSPSTKPEYERVGFEILNLKHEATARLKELRRPEAKYDMWWDLSGQVPEETEVFVLASACWRNGLHSMAVSLYREADKLPKTAPANYSKMAWKEIASSLWETVKERLQKNSAPKPTMRQKMEKSIGHAVMWRAVLDFGDPNISRAKLLQEFEVIVQKYPHSEDRDGAGKKIQALKRMIAEDEAHAKLSPEEFSRLPEQDRVRELIFRLRDQNGHQWSQPGSCDVFETRDTNTPTHQLVNMRYAAVPQLVAALDSGTLSRSVGFGHSFYFSHYVLTVGSCAAQILDRMTGKSSFAAGAQERAEPAKGEASPQRKAAEAWWAEFQSKGERQMLIEGVSAADRDAASQAELLRERYPDAALAPITNAIRLASESWVRDNLISELSKIDAPASVEFLNHEMLEGPTLGSRVAAANGLYDHDKEATVAAMIQEWKKPGVPYSEKVEDDGMRGVIGFLLGSDSVEAIAALGNNLSRLPANMKYDVIEALGENGYSPYWRKAKTLSPAVVEITESTLVAELDDSEEKVGMSGSRNGRSFSNPSIGEVAAWNLAERWTNRYSFDISAPHKSRDRRRIECMNTWRKAHQLELIPLPPAGSPRVSRDDATKVLVVEWATNSATPDPAFAAALDRLKGHRLAATSLVTMLSSFAAHRADNAGGLELNVIKDDDLTGVRIVARLVPIGTRHSRANCSCNESVRLGRKGLLASSGGGIWESFSKEKDWHEFGEAVTKALAGPPETPVEIDVSIEESDH